MTKKTENQGGPKRRDDVQSLIAERVLKALLSSDDNYKGKIDGLVGELREEIKNAVDKKHLHKGAYAMVKKFHRMKDEQLSDLWHTLLVYMDMTGVTKRIDSVQPLPLDGTQADNVHRIAAE